MSRMWFLAGDVPEVSEAEVQAKEWEHTMLQENLDKELKELDKKLEQKEVGSVNPIFFHIPVKPSSIS